MVCPWNAMCCSLVEAIGREPEYGLRGVGALA